MRKIILTIVAIFALGVYVNAQTQTYNFSATVEQYIQVNPLDEVVDIAPVGDDFHLILNPAVDGSGIISSLPWVAGFRDNIYSNSPFSITYSGDPILSRQEIDGNGVDRLETYIAITNSINWMNSASGYEAESMIYRSESEGANSGTYVNKTVTFINAPHNGQVRTDVWLAAALPHVTPDFDGDNTWNQSADAGVYTAQVVATYALAPWSSVSN